MIVRMNSYFLFFGFFTRKIVSHVGRRETTLEISQTRQCLAYARVSNLSRRDNGQLGYETKF